MDPRYRIVEAQPAHVARIADVERAAARLFDETELLPELRDETSDPEELEAARRAGWLFVAIEAGGTVVGFAHVELLDGNAHLEELDVEPSHGRRGVGRALVERVAAEARRRGLPAVTLTTFAHVPWNAPFYRSAGFAEIPLDRLPAPLARRRREEGSRGLDPATRVVMRRDTRP